MSEILSDKELEAKAMQEAIADYYKNKGEAPVRDQQTQQQVNLRIIGIPIIPLGVVMGYVKTGS